ncbi:MAG: VWA domain-containing protein [Acidobacteriaceae bacterium]|nr:VWA domain-containing protein [Acidobacteriaceae bacterium]MBV9781162.1 VWA domain-containing protein [Acidobacteriaceae bacterium]
MVRRRSGIAATALALFCVSAFAAAQFKPAPSSAPSQTGLEPQQAPTFSVRVNLVRLLVSVRDKSGAPLTDLDKTDFHVFDSGLPQEIAVFERNTSLPLSVAIMIDTSGSTQIELHNEVDSVVRFIPTLLNAGNPDDAFALFTFNWRTNMELDFSRNQHRAEHVLHALRGEGGTSLYDSIYLVSDTIADREGRHVMVLVTDGGDTTSYKRYGDALKAAQRADVVMYPVIVVPIASDAGRNVGGEHALATLAESTGGRIFYAQGFEQLDRSFAEILHALRTQYLVGFYPRNVREQPGLFHPVKVELRDPSLKISVKTGYYQP